MIEIEAKIKIDNPDPLRRKLIEAGAKFVSEAEQLNIYYDYPDSRINNEGAALRVRYEDDRAILTYKGKLIPSKYKSRPEIETVSDNKAIEEILKKLGLIEKFRFNKTRESYKFNSCRVEIDFVTEIGHFVEIEAESEDDISEAIKILDIKGKHTNKSYVALIMEKKQH